jgi:hypothetical protein
MMYIPIVLTVLYTIYSVAMLRSIRLFTDETGVWMHSGVFPWEMGIIGVKWRDISEATYQRGFLGWVLRSYSVRVGHRFTNGQELLLSNVHRGNYAVEHINLILSDVAGRVSSVRA